MAYALVYDYIDPITKNQTTRCFGAFKNADEARVHFDNSVMRIAANYHNVRLVRIVDVLRPPLAEKPDEPAAPTPARDTAADVALKPKPKPKHKDEIARVLTLSTGHIKYKTNLKLTAECASPTGDLPVVYDKGGYGWWIAVPDPEPQHDRYPKDIQRLLKYARKRKCEWICLDSDGDTDPNLKSYNW